MLKVKKIIDIMIRIGKKEYNCKNYEGSVPGSAEDNSVIISYLNFVKERGVKPIYCDDSKELEFSDDTEEKFYENLRAELAQTKFLIKTIIIAGKFHLAYFVEFLVYLLHERYNNPEEAIDVLEEYNGLTDL